MAKLIASFATRPTQGSEGGVGWAFASQAAAWAVDRREKLFVVIDERDFADIGPSIGATEDDRKWVEVVPVRVPKLLLKKYGNSRTRATYVGWMLRARFKIAELVMRNDIDVVHQVTFATMSLPHVLPTRRGLRTVWGPVAVPSAPVAAPGKKPRVLERVGVRGLQILAKQHARKVDLIIATNKFTRHHVGESLTALEPNIFVDAGGVGNAPKEDDLLTFCGLLIDRKRPWIAIKAMLDPRLAHFRLQIVGDGVLRPELERFVQQEQLQDRVRFLGRVDRSLALRSIARSRVLLHPAAREGAAWVIGEAAALGVPAVAFEGSGADSTVSLSENGGHVAAWQGDEDVSSFVNGIVEVLSRPRPEPTFRWSVDRIPALLDQWWSPSPARLMPSD